IIGKCVFTPWPTSGFLDRIVTTPSGATRIKARASNARAAVAAAPDAAWTIAAPVSVGRRYKPIKTPPLATELTFRKHRRLRTVPRTVVMLAISHLAGWRADSNAEGQEPHAKLSKARTTQAPETIPSAPQNGQR